MTHQEMMDTLRNMMTHEITAQEVITKLKVTHETELLKKDKELEKSQRGNESLQEVIKIKDSIITDLKDTLKFYKELSVTKNDKNNDKKNEQKDKNNNNQQEKNN